TANVTGTRCGAPAGSTVPSRAARAAANRRRASASSSRIVAELTADPGMRACPDRPWVWQWLRVVHAMARVIHVFRQPDRFVAGTVGEPGDRTFYLQASEDVRMVSVSSENHQTEWLAARMGQQM